jgi:hypothetical protein
VPVAVPSGGASGNDEGAAFSARVDSWQQTAKGIERLCTPAASAELKTWLGTNLRAPAQAAAADQKAAEQEQARQQTLVNQAQATLTTAAAPARDAARTQLDAAKTELAKAQENTASATKTAEELNSWSQYDATVSRRIDRLCEAFGSGGKFDLTPFTNRELAAAAVAVDEETVEAVRTELRGLFPNSVEARAGKELADPASPFSALYRGVPAALLW